jgi:hypothetical protein
MSSTELLNWFNAIGTLACSWPTLLVIALFAFRRPLRELIRQFTAGELRKARIGPLELERELGELAVQGRQAVGDVRRLSELMAESRLLELEITEGMFGNILSPEQRARMLDHIEELRKLTLPLQQG